MLKSDAYILTLQALEVGKYQYDFVLGNDWFQAVEKSEIVAGQVEVHDELALRERDYDLSMSLKGSVDVPCDRCLEPVTYKVDIDEDIESEPETEKLDLEWLAYELIVTNLPLVHCHPEGGCNPAMEQLLQDHLCRAEEEPEETI